MKILKITAIILLLSLSVNASETPIKLDGATLIDAVKAKSMMDAGGTTVVDTRVANEYAESHIKGSISIPYKEKSTKDINYDGKLDTFDIGKLSTDKNAKIIMYCNAGECWKSYKASKTAVQSGYKSIYWFRGGIPEWKSKGFPVE